MQSIDSIAHALFFSASAEAARQSFGTAKEKKTSAIKKSIFSSAMEKKTAEQKMLDSGLPVELAEMSEEEAIVFLKDAVDIAGEALKHSFTPQNFTQFRSAIGNFVRYVEKNNYEIVRRRRYGYNRKGKRLDPRVEIHVINQKLDALASDVMYNQADNIKILASVDEIKGLIVDLLAV